MFDLILIVALHEEGLERRTTRTIEINSFARQLFDIMPERVFVDIYSVATESSSAGCGLSVGWVQSVSCGAIIGLGVITRELINSFPSLVSTTRSCGGAQLQHRSRCKGQSLVAFEKIAPDQFTWTFAGITKPEILGIQTRFGLETLTWRFLIPEHLSNFFGYQHFRLCKCALDNPDLFHLSWL
ncbi:hypothetical protein LXL04_012332 [Taraxacum kok-saghyz]